MASYAVVEPDAVEIRVVACLVEKQRTTPDQYPLTLNSLRLACNQTTNRDPVVNYDGSAIRSALERLGRRKWTTLASWSTARSVKYKHLLDEALGLSDAELALLTVLMLRGPQTAGELRQRTERMYRFGSGEEPDRTLEQLVSRELTTLLPRRPGERGQRYEHLLGGERQRGQRDEHLLGGESEGEVVVLAPVPAPSPGPAAGTDDGLAGRVERLEEEVHALRAQLRSLREELGA